ncbi:hypothetical protein FSARC_3970 [Fusarium sarcochroum]|uniref:Heterokaryon incompatibility domain-containing protein n=1 Tax=Fusarium sarcochroum TaxID=1208366 RepID=A0A8H4U2V8_9HYPO|nr:hypothetical protein FSARC_3970 [Fusarium sarcochroum]
MSTYLWRIFDKAWEFKLPSFGAHLFSPIRRTYSISFGCWFHIASQDVQSHAVPTLVDKNASKFEYLPLATNDIRVFVLNPGVSTDVVTGQVEHINWGWNSGNGYEALSYVWGDITDSTTILINGEKFSITKSLMTALCHLRYTDRPRTLWIDSICINQADIVERNQQVARMGSIYQEAKDVAIWLGPSTSTSPVGMEVLRYFSEEKRPHACPVWQTRPQSLVYQGLQDVLTRSWFQRMWVVQEIGRSHRAILMCGHDCVEWQSTSPSAVRCFVRMIKYAEILPEWTQLGLDTINTKPLLEMLDYQDANQFSKTWGTCEREAPGIVEIAHTMRFKKCLDPRDRVFGIWGMVDYLYDMDDFKPDYRMTVKQVYEEVVRLAFS